MFIISTIIYATPKLQLSTEMARRHFSNNKYYNNNNSLIGIEAYYNKYVSIYLGTMENSFNDTTNIFTVNLHYKKFISGIGVSNGYKKVNRVYKENSYIDFTVPFVNDNNKGLVGFLGYEKYINNNTQLKILIFGNCITILLNFDLLK
jgi:hypothetical protein